MSIDLADPISNIIEALLARRVVSEDDTLCASIIRLSDRAEPLLAGGVPYLNFYIFTVQLNCVNLEINTCRNEEILS